ncbi:5-amino-6-(D-ribitylamino)uracil--L-tyrosine 4-hydroxyphenyl transferase CofH [Methylobacterium organophilum]|uniref:5-amino-6-(D-ribitylamino)uracil--L-tyrosine 4-hydroxyphenyl transferase CofH n=1 Tax=Methylobacterium organophilum TaxID=410 RepID=UPI001F13D756|nr:5-amino-6-(D-ribitylamino)uracil--L-tyrosine 4-hydroxyphenyl transferase CofH [Methylobacterium organophilum]UMY16327.1 5-amino-6-(D-ribitylamino)uracil--L-tyrosine 4-hydroxyphenyl transferase CofH [Methylobacterium organophilum]
MTASFGHEAGFGRLSAEEALVLAEVFDLDALTARAAALRDAGFGDTVSYSRKVFIPLTQLCRDTCRYCTFARAPAKVGTAFLPLEDVLAIARQGAKAGCTEALFTLGDKPELRYRAAREGLAVLGHARTLDYLYEAAERVFRETGLMPHLNPGLMEADDLARLRLVSVSMGIMLETASERLSQRGGPHFGSPDKRPAARLETIRLAGEGAIPFTSGLLIGIGETRRERIEALLALRDLHDRYGHLQEIIVQNFRAKPGTAMAGAPEPDFEDHLWTIAVTRLVFGAGMSIQAPPNLAKGALPRMIAAGVNDWGGVSPVTPDHVNPEAPWPHLDILARATAAAGKHLVQRLPVYPSHLREPERWLAPPFRTPALRAIDADGFVRDDDWSPGEARNPPTGFLRDGRAAPVATSALGGILRRAQAGHTLGESDLLALFAARGEAFRAVCTAADELRASTNGDTVSYVVTRNINYTNLCTLSCRFCAFSKGKTAEHLRGKPYDLSLDEIERRAREAWSRGATEVCMQGGIHPDYTGETYLDICRAVKAAVPGLHVHAFSPLEIWQGAATLGLPLAEYLARLKAAGLSSLPGTAAEILDDEVRAVLCPDKIDTTQWFAVMEAAHGAGLRSTATIMFGHVERPVHWARHILRIRALQRRTGGFTEFVPLPFVHMEAPIALKGLARRGPTFRETLLMHAVARLALHPLVPNIQASWVKLGAEGVAQALRSGVNDLGGTLMNETISRSAGAAHGQEMTPAAMEALIRRCGRVPVQRTTLYGLASEERSRAAAAAPFLTDVVNDPLPRRATSADRPLRFASRRLAKTAGD